jgi:acyl carrier protein
MPTKMEIRAAIERVLKVSLEMSGHQCPPITDTTKAVGELEGFDSLSGVEATSLLEKELNCTLSEGSAFVYESSGGTKRALTVAQAVERVAEMMTATRAA